MQRICRATNVRSFRGLSSHNSFVFVFVLLNFTQHLFAGRTMEDRNVLSADHGLGNGHSTSLFPFQSIRNDWQPTFIIL